MHLYNKEYCSLTTTRTPSCGVVLPTSSLNPTHGHLLPPHPLRRPRGRLPVQLLRGCAVHVQPPQRCCTHGRGQASGSPEIQQERWGPSGAQGGLLGQGAALQPSGQARPSGRDVCLMAAPPASLLLTLHPPHPLHPRTPLQAVPLLALHPPNHHHHHHHPRTTLQATRAAAATRLAAWPAT